MGLVSGHGERDIIGKQSNIRRITQALVLWSWSEQEFQAYCDATQGTSFKVKADIYKICGGSVRNCFRAGYDQLEIDEAAGELSQEEKGAFLIVNTRPTMDEQNKQHSSLLAFFPKSPERGFNLGVVNANQVPRSDYVIQCIRAGNQGSPKRVKEIYHMVSPYNPGAAGTAFEMLVHLFWRHVIQNRHVVNLKLWRHDGEKPTETIQVNGGELQGDSEAIEEYDNEKKIAADGLTGYFTPKDFKYPVLDSILRYKQKETIMVLAIQISIAQTHQHDQPRSNSLLEKKGEEKPKPKLALWDFGAKDKRCTWTPTTSDYWDLMYVECKEFMKWFQQISWEGDTVKQFAP